MLRPVDGLQVAIYVGVVGLVLYFDGLSMAMGVASLLVGAFHHGRDYEEEVTAGA